MTLGIRKSPRSWRCVCLARNTGKVCGTCKTRKGTGRKSVKARCDKLARQVVMARDQKCRACGAVSALDWAHIFPRRHHSVRWAPENAVALCRSCHRYYTDHPHSWSQWLIDKFGAMEMVALERRANTAWDRDYGAVLAALTAQLADARRKT